MNTSPQGSRPYRQVVRAQASEATARRIVEAFVDCTLTHWFDEITLEEVARRAAVTVRTVIRRFGGKEGLVEAAIAYLHPRIAQERTAAPGDVEGAVDRVMALYEWSGNSVIRNLAQEPRHPALGPLLDLGRREHRRITEATYARWLDPLDEPARRRALDLLVVATDIYVWRILRRDMGRAPADTRAAMLALVRSILASTATADACPIGDAR